MLSSFALIVAFTVKHYIYANLVDAGYTKSRERIRFAMGYWLTYMLTETLGTVVIGMPMFPWRFVVYLAVMEWVVMGTGCLMERRATIQQALPRYLLAESSIIGLYVLFVTVAS